MKYRCLQCNETFEKEGWAIECPNPKCGIYFCGDDECCGWDYNCEEIGDEPKPE